MKVKKAKVYVLRRLMLPLLSVVLLMSCSRHGSAWQQLLEAEKLLDADLPAAAALIDSVDASPLRGEDAALYAILKTQTDYKRYIPLTSDSLPRVATEYYGTPYRKNHRAAMAWYSLGCYYTEQHDDGDAVEVYLKAKELFPDTLSRYHALCYQNIGKHLYLHDLPKNAIPYLLSFHDHPACTVDSALLSNADYCLGVAYLRNSEFSKAEELFYAVLNNRYSSEHDATNVFFQLSKLLYHEHENYGASLALIEKYIRECDSTCQSGALWVMKGNVYYHYNKLDSAMFYYRRALQEPSDIYTRCDIYKHLLNLAPQMNETDSIPYYTEQYTSLLSEIYERERESEIMEANMKHDKALMLHRRQEILLVCGTFLAGILLIVAFYSISRRQRSILRSTTMDNKEHSAPGSSIHELVSQCRKAFDQTPAASFITIKPHIEKRLASDKRNLLEQTLKDTFAPVEKSLSEDCIGITPDDSLLCMYMLLGLTSKEIMMHSRFSASSIASRKTRLRSKLSSDWQSAIFGIVG